MKFNMRFTSNFCRTDLDERNPQASILLKSYSSLVEFATASQWLRSPFEISRKALSLREPRLSR